MTGIATLHHGTAIRSDGIDLEQALALFDSGESLAALGDAPAPSSNLEFIQACPADALLENSPVNHDTGQPAIDHLKAALEKGMHAITANKGPVVHGFQELNDLAAEKGRRFLFESTVMDGAPIFSLFRGPLPAVQISGFFGILNSCTNYILGRMEKGETFEQAVASAQSIGITETDPSDDIDGWDASIKVAALSTVLMHAPLTPQQVERHGIRWISPEMIAEAAKENKRWKLVCRAKRRGERVEGAGGARKSRRRLAAVQHQRHQLVRAVRYRRFTRPGHRRIQPKPNHYRLRAAGRPGQRRAGCLKTRERSLLGMGRRNNRRGLS